MRLKTQLTAVVSIAIALVLGMGVATLMVASRSAEVSKAQGKVHQAQKRVADLLALTHEFTTYSEVRAEQQWRSNYAAFLELLAGGTSEFAVYSSKAQKEAQPIAAIFQQIVDARASRSALRDRQVELLVGQLTIGMQAASDAVDQWSEAIDETDRRRKLQTQYNVDHGITPQTIRKAISSALSEEMEARKIAREAVNASEEEYDVAELVAQLEQEMFAAAEALEFEKAAGLRDRVTELKGMIIGGKTTKKEKATKGTKNTKK